MTLQTFLNKLRSEDLITEIEQVSDLRIALTALTTLVPSLCAPLPENISMVQTALRMLIALHPESRDRLSALINRLYREKYFPVTHQLSYSASITETADIIIPLLVKTNVIQSADAEFYEYIFQLGAKHAARIITQAVDAAFDRALTRMKEFNGQQHDGAMSVMEAFFRASPIPLDSASLLFDDKKPI